MPTDEQRDEAVRLAVYDHFVRAGVMPEPAELVAQLSLSDGLLAESYRRLAE